MRPGCIVDRRTGSKPSTMYHRHRPLTLNRAANTCVPRCSTRSSGLCTPCIRRTGNTFRPDTAPCVGYLIDEDFERGHHVTIADLTCEAQRHDCIHHCVFPLTLIDAVISPCGSRELCVKLLVHISKIVPRLWMTHPIGAWWVLRIGKKTGGVGWETATIGKVSS